MLKKFMISLLFLTATQANAYKISFKEKNNEEPFYEACMGYMPFLGRLFEKQKDKCFSRETKPDVGAWKNDIATIFYYANITVTHVSRKNDESCDIHTSQCPGQILFTFQFDEAIAKQMEEITKGSHMNVFRRILRLSRRRSKEGYLRKVEFLDSYTNKRYSLNELKHQSYGKKDALKIDSYTALNIINSYPNEPYSLNELKQQLYGKKDALNIISFLLLVGTPRSLFIDIITVLMFPHCEPINQGIVKPLWPPYRKPLPFEFSATTYRKKGFLKDILVKIESVKKYLPNGHWLHDLIPEELPDKILTKYNLLVRVEKKSGWFW